MKNIKPFFALLALLFLLLPSCRGGAANPPSPTASAALLTVLQSTAAPILSETPNPAPTKLALSPIPSRTPTLAPTPIPFGSLARQHLTTLSDGIGSRLAGSPDEAAAAKYIEDAFKEMGYSCELQPFSLSQDLGTGSNSVNVIAVKPGLSTQEIIVGAHYDSTEDGKGADDNASGVAVLLEAAARIFNVQTPYTIRFIAFGAEETNLNGSRYYVDHMNSTAIRNTLRMVNLDSLIAGDIAYVYGEAGESSLRDWILSQAALDGFALEGRTAQELDNADGSPCDCSDYSPFQKVGVPFAYFEATNWNLAKDAMTQVDPQFGDQGAIWHTKYDRISYIDATFPGRIDQHLNLFVTLLYQALTQYP